MRNLAIVTGTVLVLAIFAGCTTNESTLSPTNTSTTTTPTISVGTGTASVVSVASSPASAPAGADLTVCWQVTGTGNVAHTALHYDAASHPNSTSFADYTGGATYPANGTAASAAGYDLPGTFCSNLPIPATGTLYYRAHVIDSAGAPGILSDELAIAAGDATTAGATGIRVASSPTSAPANTDATVCWSVEGSGNIPHTALHYDVASHAGASAVFSDYAGGASYPGNQTAAAATGYDLPETFCTNLPLPASGTLYYRAHYIDASGAPGTVTDEWIITVG